MNTIRTLAVVAVAALGAFGQDRADDEVTKEYDLGALLRPVPDSPAPYIGMLCGVLGDGSVESDVTVTTDEAQPVQAAETIMTLVTELSGTPWAEDALRISGDRKLVARATADVHKKLERIVATLKARLAPEIAVDATIVEMQADALRSVVEGAHGALPDDRLLRLQQILKEGKDAASPRRVRLAAQPFVRTHVAALEETAYVADVDLQMSEGKANYKAVTAVLKSGLTLQIEPSLFGTSIALNYTLADAKLEATEPLATVADTTLQLPRVRRTTLAGGLMLPNTATAFAGAMSIPGRAGWMRALFVRPQLDPGAFDGKAFEPEGELRVAAWPIGPLGDAMGQGPQREDFAELVKESVEPGSWNDDAGTYAQILGTVLMVRNTPAVLQKTGEWLAARGARERATVTMQLRLIRAEMSALGEAAMGEPLSARTVEKLLERAAKGDGATVVWESMASAASGTRIDFGDRMRRTIVSSYPVDLGAPDPLVTIVEWGAMGTIAPFAPPQRGGRIRLEATAFEFATAVEPCPTAPGPEKLALHIPKLTRSTFSLSPELDAGVWTSIGLTAFEKDTLVLLARASVAP